MKRVGFRPSRDKLASFAHDDASPRMKPGSPSSTSLLIARSLLLADATRALRPLLLADSAALTRRLLDAAPPAGWFDLALRYSVLRRLLLAVERLFVSGILLHWLARKRLL